MIGNHFWVDPTAMHPLFLASASGDVECLRAVLMSAKPDKADQFGATALHVACRRGNVECARTLIAAGASLEARTVNGETPLIMACHAASADCVRLLVDRGADLEAATRNGHTALVVAAGLCRVDAVQILLSAGAIETHALAEASRRGHASLVALMLDNHRASRFDALNNPGSILYLIQAQGFTLPFVDTESLRTLLHDCHPRVHDLLEKESHLMNAASC